MRPFEKSTPLALKILRFDRINLRYVSNSYMRVINMPALEDLSIWKCPGADALFAELSKPHLRPSHLKALRLYHHEDDQHYGAGALESFLQSTSGLVTLRIDIRNAKELPKEDCIIKHSASLESLSIYAFKNGPDVFRYSTGPLGRICSTCTGLRQLSITPPPTSSLLAYGNEDFETFLVSDEKFYFDFLLEASEVALSSGSTCPHISHQQTTSHVSSFINLTFAITTTISCPHSSPRLTALQEPNQNTNPDPRPASPPSPTSEPSTSAPGPPSKATNPSSPRTAAPSTPTSFPSTPTSCNASPNASSTAPTTTPPSRSYLPTLPTAPSAPPSSTLSPSAATISPFSATGST